MNAHKAHLSPDLEENILLLATDIHLVRVRAELSGRQYTRPILGVRGIYSCCGYDLHAEPLSRTSFYCCRLSTCAARGPIGVKLSR